MIYTYYLPMTILQARKILGKLADKLTDDQVKNEIDLSELFTELALMFYSKNKGGYNGESHA